HDAIGLRDLKVSLDGALGHGQAGVPGGIIQEELGFEEPERDDVSPVLQDLYWPVEELGDEARLARRLRRVPHRGHDIFFHILPPPPRGEPFSKLMECTESLAMAPFGAQEACPLEKLRPPGLGSCRSAPEPFPRNRFGLQREKLARSAGKNLA